ncbi:hypothetical protein Cgig2_030887 [Carnegiea gigantea]|uniref:Uncharacterized protein n=1 Tax=Carnegiea gigantea TaxID=171969 RepID=A0A9Q1KGK1_9CARY|nr:hypothetical protein Cgig2_030887 [Carnegiea gigantea]
MKALYLSNIWESPNNKQVVKTGLQSINRQDTCQNQAMVIQAHLLCRHNCAGKVNSTGLYSFWAAIFVLPEEVINKGVDLRNLECWNKACIAELVWAIAEKKRCATESKDWWEYAPKQDSCSSGGAPLITNGSGSMAKAILSQLALNPVSMSAVKSHRQGWFGVG